MLRVLHRLLLIALLAPGVASAQDDEPAAVETEAEPEADEGEDTGDDTLEAEEQREDEDSMRASAEGEDVIRTLGSAIEELGVTLPPEEQRQRQRVRWDPTWPRYRFDELVITVGAGLVILFEELLPTRTDANWQAVTGFELDVQNALSLSSPSGRDALEEISNGIAIGLVAWPVLFDAVLYAGVGENAWDVAWQLAVIGLEVFSLNHTLNVLVRVLARRERPLGRFCREDPTYDDPICSDQPPAESFWSPQVSNAFAGAALVCMYHDALDLFGDAWADGMACGTAVAAAAATGLFRIMADQNWITDVLSGAVVGTAIGIFVPWVLHFQGGARPPLTGQDPPAITVLPLFDGQDTLGVSVMGRM